jgi:Lumazine binding domain
MISGERDRFPRAGSGEPRSDGVLKRTGFARGSPQGRWACMPESSEALGTVATVETSDGRARIAVDASLTTASSERDWLAVDGVCLAVVSREDGRLSADVMLETMRRSSPGAVTAGCRVNSEYLERLAR